MILKIHMSCLMKELFMPKVLEILKTHSVKLTKEWDVDFDKRADIKPGKLHDMEALLKKKPSKPEQSKPASPLKLIYSDFHSHWDGILPVKDLIELWERNALPLQRWERDLFPNAAVLNPVNLNTLEWMFLRLSAAILNTKARPTPAGGAPARGAHLIQYITIYLWWWAYLLGVRNPRVDWTPADYRDLWTSTINLLNDLYTACIQRGRNPLRDLYALKAVQKYLRASKTAPFDDSYVARSSLLGLIPRPPFDDRTIDYLTATENIGYIQVSQPPDKIDAPDGQVRIHNRNHPGRAITVHWLALAASHHHYMRVGPPPVFEDNKIGEDLAVALAAINGDVGGGNVVGIDWAGPEGYEWRLGNAISLVRHTLRDLYNYSARHNRTLVFRPHVGEGSALLEGGRSLIETEPNALIDLIRACFISSWDYLGTHPGHFETAQRLLGHRIVREVLRNPKDSFQTLQGAAYTEASRRATNNIGTLLEAIKQFHQANRQIPGNVRIRFGHATHTTPQQAQWMARLNIAADINMGSNLRTGALSYMQNLDEGDVWKYLFKNWNWNILPLFNHSIIPLCNAGAQVVLGTDGQGVEVTRIGYEYLLAYHLLTTNQFLQVTGANVIAQRV